ncbi:MAG: TIM barrel protein [Deltaproteobacteria bacterium]|nr:TIM barrel protein [Deltaproteobacteria bacterium]MBW2122008.1 TIM barrel protein [Deltaproteobacteria bacterium]
MAREFKYATGLWCLGGCADRFVPSGYLGRSYQLRELIDMAASVEGIKGIELFSSQLEGVDLKETRSYIRDKGLQATGILANTFGDRRFKLGSITHTDERLRREAIDLCKHTVEMAEKIECPAVTLWLGSDGFDYPFQVDYVGQLDSLIESIKDIADFNPNLRICLEYKLKEPRMYLAVGNVGKALYLALECGENVGVTLDFGHALMSKEKPGESVALLSRHGRLFNVHINDAYGEWDDDLIVGSVHIPDTLEFLYYLDLTGYDGWLGLDIFPFREDALKAAGLCIKNLNNLVAMLDRMDYGELRRAQDTLDAGVTQEVVSKVIFGK